MTPSKQSPGQVLEGDGRELRAALIAGHLIGMATLRYVARLEPLADASVDDVVAAYAPPMQLLISR